MKIRAADLKTGNRIWCPHGSKKIVTVETVHVFGEKRSALVAPGMPQAYLPGAVLVTWSGDQFYSFGLDDYAERAFFAE